MKGFFKNTGLVILVIVILLGLTIGSWVWNYYTAEPRGIVDAEQTIQSGDNRIDKYNMFFDMCSKVQSLEDNIRTQKQQLKTITDDSYKDKIRTNIVALESSRMRVIRDYNQEARKSYTSGQFRSSDLPYQLPAVEFTNEVRTQCN